MRKLKSEEDRSIETKEMHFEGVGIDEFEGVIERFSSVLGYVDRLNDRIQPGAVTKTVAERKAKIPMGVDHKHGFGVTLEIESAPRRVLEVKCKCSAMNRMMGADVRRRDLSVVEHSRWEGLPR